MTSRTAFNFDKEVRNLGLAGQYVLLKRLAPDAAPFLLDEAHRVFGKMHFVYMEGGTRDEQCKAAGLNRKQVNALTNALYTTLLFAWMATPTPKRPTIAQVRAIIENAAECEPLAYKED